MTAISKAYLTIPECAKHAGISVRRMRTMIRIREPHDPDLVQGTARRPLVQRDALVKMLGRSVFSAEERLDDHEVRISVLERKCG